MDTLQDRMDNLSNLGFCLVEVQGGLQVVMGKYVHGDSSWTQYRGLDDLLEIPADVLVMVCPGVLKLTQRKMDSIIEQCKTAGWVGLWVDRGFV